MSNEVKTKEKVDMDPKYIIKLTVTLFVTCVIVAGLLGLVNSVTEGPIAEKNKTKTAAAIQEVLPEMEGSPAVVELTDEMTAAASGCRSSTCSAAANAPWLSLQMVTFIWREPPFYLLHIDGRSGRAPAFPPSNQRYFIISLIKKEQEE